VGLAGGQFALQRDNFAESRRPVHQRPYPLDAGACVVDASFEVAELLGDVLRVAAQRSPPTDRRVEPGEEAVDLVGRQLEHQVATRVARVTEVDAGVVQLAVVVGGEAHDLVHRGGCIGDLQPHRHRDDQLAGRHGCHWCQGCRFAVVLPGGLPATE